MDHTSNDLLPAIFGCEGIVLTDRETQLFKRSRPVGYILFARNCESPEQLTALTESMLALHKDYTPLILIDQEGGRVARLKEPHWTTPPAPQTFADMVCDSSRKACAAAYDNSVTIAHSLRAHHINVNCAPMCDVRFEHSHNIIGDRAYGCDAQQVTMLAREVAKGLMDEGVLPVIKHIPGHGRATLDSHEALPVVDASLEELMVDAEPFKQLADLPLAMTAHIIYTAIDPSLPATLSPKVIRFIREEIGFSNIIMSDDLCMKALSGDMGTIAQQTLDAGCDLALHCDGNYDAMKAIIAALDAHPRFALKQLEALYQYLR